MTQLTSIVNEGWVEWVERTGKYIYIDIIQIALAIYDTTPLYDVNSYLYDVNIICVCWHHTGSFRNLCVTRLVNSIVDIIQITLVAYVWQDSLRVYYYMYWHHTDNYRNLCLIWLLNSIFLSIYIVIIRIALATYAWWQSSTVYWWLCRHQTDSINNLCVTRLLDSILVYMLTYINIHPHHNTGEEQAHIKSGETAGKWIQNINN